MLSTLSALFLGAAVLLSTATQLRFASFGVGEVCGAIGIIGVFVSIRSLPSIAVRYLAGICVIAAGMIVGLLINVLFLDEHFRAFDFWAMCYAQLTAWAILVLGYKTGKSSDLILPALLAFPLVQIGLLALSILGIVSIPVWYGGDASGAGTVPFVSRFMGWSVNPNQIGISLSALPFWLIFFLGAASRTFTRAGIIIALAATFLCGLLIRSNTVFLAWICGGIVLFLMSFRWRWRTIAFFLPMLLVGLLAIVGLTKDLIPTLLEKGDASDLNGRLPLWLDSLESWARSPLFGLGPGPHVPDASGAVAESHMLILDLLTQGGIIAAGGMIYLFWIAFRLAHKLGHASAVAATLALFVEALAHNTQRHPMFWLYLILPMLIFTCTLRKRGYVRSSIESVS